MSNPHDIALAFFAALEAAWNGADGAAFGNEFADDADFVDIRGEHHRGRAAIGAGHQAIFETVYRGSTLSYAVDQARLVDEASIVSHATSRLMTPGPPFPEGASAKSSALLVRDGDRWVAAAFHNTLVMSRNGG